LANSLPPTWGFAILGLDVVIFIIINMAAVVRAGQTSVGFWLLSCTFVFQSAAVSGLTFFKSPNIAKPCSLAANFDTTMTRHFFIFIWTLTLYFYSKGQTIPINDSITHNVFLIQVDSSQGTCFVIEIKNREFLVTAKHLFKNPTNNQTKEILLVKEKNVLKLNSTLFLNPDTTIDIALLKLPISIKYKAPFVTGGQVKTGQDVFFLGYPSFNNTLFATQDTAFGILPLVKKATLSGAKKINNYFLVFLDGHNNPGFSGGPIVFFDTFTKKNSIMGVISGYYKEYKYTKNLGVPKLDYIEENSGIIACYTIEQVYQIIDQNFLLK